MDAGNRASTEGALGEAGAIADVGVRTPTVGALGDAEAIAEKTGMRILNIKLIGIRLC